MLIFLRNRGGRQCSPPDSQGRWQLGSPEGHAYHTLATGTDAVHVPVAAARPVMDHLVHEDHVSCFLRLADQLTLLGICGEKDHAQPPAGL